MFAEQRSPGHRFDVRKTPSRQFAMRQVDPMLVRLMARQLQCRKPEHVMAQLGISLNTWDKLLNNEPIRASVADRLVVRFNQHNNS